MDHSLPIPDIFFQHAEATTFQYCISCNRDLYADDCDYIMEKAIRQFPDLKAREVVFEYALCMPCALQAREKLSDSSKKAIEDWMQSPAVVSHAREAGLYGQYHEGDATPFCMCTGKPLEKCEEFQIYALCHGRHLLPATNAFMLSGEALEEIAGLLSEETRDELDNFKDTHFGLPPELEDLIRSRDLILL